MSITETIRWIDSNSAQLQEKYSGRYVAVQINVVIAVGETYNEVYRKAKLISPEKEFVVEFVDRGDLHAFHLEVPNKKS